ncbi:MAG: hypothetical protein HYX32_11230 [Actinobacteria bacterium]|nr:hypothetical protein [Actinomycetota bacterium]
MPNTTLGSWRSFVESPLAVVAGFLATAALLLMGLAPQSTGIVSVGQFLLSLIALGCVAVLAYRDPDPRTVDAR